MRITNKIMQNNSLRNINTNKELQDKLNTQMATGEKITRPSDDPVIAIRSLRLSTTVTKLAQYNEKNAEDAESWLFVTEGAIDSAEGVLSGIYNECERGVGDDMNTADYQAILEKIKQLRDEFYCNGDAESAGQNLFTGYRTESKLTFQANENVQYGINQNFTLKDMQTRTHIFTTDPANPNPNGDVFGYTEANGFTVDETQVQPVEYKRIRLAYDHIDIPDAPDADSEPTIAFMMKDGTESGTKIADLVVINSDDPRAYAPKADEAYLLADTGEIVFGSDIEKEMSQYPNTTQFSINYDKSVWSKGDLRPEHYFDCTVTKDKDKDPVEYASGSRQEIRYDLGYNQSIQVNTAADEVFTHDVGRDVDDLEVMINQLDKLDDIVTSLKKKTASLAGDELKDAEKQLAAAEKAQTLLKDQIQKTFGSTMTTMQGYADMAHLALTAVGSRGARLELIQNRLSSQQDTFHELLVKNNHKEIEDSTTELASARLTYDAALSATSQLLKTSLMNYI